MESAIIAAPHARRGRERKADAQSLSRLAQEPTWRQIKFSLPFLKSGVPGKLIIPAAPTGENREG